MKSNRGTFLKNWIDSNKTEKIIIDELTKGRPDYSIISEENGVKKKKDN